MATQKTPIIEVALASATSANGTARNGAMIPTNGIQPGCLVANCTITIVTGSVVCTMKWQGSNDNSTWVDLADSFNPANVTVTATNTRAVNAPDAAWAFEYIRFVMTLSGAATAGGDLTAANYQYRAFRGY
jgi:hypothetical protein